jgi:hypothetical protein
MSVLHNFPAKNLNWFEEEMIFQTKFRETWIKMTNFRTFLYFTVNGGFAKRTQAKSHKVFNVLECSRSDPGRMADDDAVANLCCRKKHSRGG